MSFVPVISLHLSSQAPFSLIISKTVTVIHIQWNRLLKNGSSPVNQWKALQACGSKSITGLEVTSSCFLSWDVFHNWVTLGSINKSFTPQEASIGFQSSIWTHSIQRSKNAVHPDRAQMIANYNCVSKYLRWSLVRKEEKGTQKLPYESFIE